MTEAGPSAQSEKREFSSRLKSGRERYLAHAIEHTFEVGRRTPEDFIRHFPPEVIMEGLAHHPRLRANILVETTGLKQKIAMRKTWQSSAEDLQIALDEAETDASVIIGVFSPDDRVRYLDAKKIWQFLIEGEFWAAPTTDFEQYRLAKEHLAFLMERALVDELVSHQDMVEGITVAEMAKHLPKEELGKLIEGALNKAKAKAPFTEVDLLAEMPPFVLVEYIPLPHIWSTVIETKVAEQHGYADPRPVEAAEAQETPVSSLPPRDSDWVELKDDADAGAEEAEDDLATP